MTVKPRIKYWKCSEKKPLTNFYCRNWTSVCQENQITTNQCVEYLFIGCGSGITKYLTLYVGWKCKAFTNIWTGYEDNITIDGLYRW